jgi:4-amino-4-deoxy-L-arabinose transferase-like glycosyltransferase
VALVGLLPWAIFGIAAVVETVRGWKAEGRRIFDGEDGLDVFLLLWLALPIVFFSFSQSKLPGYIVPALPAAPILVAGFVRRRTSSNQPVGPAGVLLHALFAGILVVPCFLISYIVLVHRLPWGVGTLATVVLSLALTVVIFTTVRGRFGLRLLHFSTLIPVVLSVAALIRMGGVALDEENSVRPVSVALARSEAGTTSPLPIAVLEVPRQTEYGLAFYRNQIVASYDRGEIPEGPHLLVAKEGAQADLAKVVGQRVVELIGSSPAQHLEYYRISGVTR